MIYAQITDNEVTATATAPTGRGWDHGRWWDFPDELDDWLTAGGWAPVVEADRPDDTETGTHVLAYEVIDGVPHQVWAYRDWTVEEVALRATVTDLGQRIAALEAWRTSLDTVIDPETPVPDDPSVPTWADLVPPNWWHAGTLLRDTDGTIYRNISGNVLTTPPSGFPGGGVAWRGQYFVVVTSGTNPDPVPDRPVGYVGPWSAQTTYAVGDVCDRGGRYYRCKVAHGPEYQGTWGPPQASVWDDIGPET